MKRIFSLLLVSLMVFMMIPTTHAAYDDNGFYCSKCGSKNFNPICYDCVEDSSCADCGHCDTCDGFGHSTEVVYEGQGTAQYTITVPALLAPGGSGDVVASGTWASNCKVKVTADTEVVLTNSINANDQKVLDVTFAGINLAGSNTEAVTDTKVVSVADIDNALFGTWSGKFNYNVEFVELIKFTVSSRWDSNDKNDFIAEEGMTWAEFAESAYNPLYGDCGIVGIANNQVCLYWLGSDYYGKDDPSGYLHVLPDLLGTDIIIANHNYLR